MIFPLTFIANTFVPSESLPTVLRTFAEWNPISAVTRRRARPVRQHQPGGSATRRGRCGTLRCTP